VKPIKNRDLLAAVAILALVSAAASLVSVAREAAGARRFRDLTADLDRLETSVGQLEAGWPAMREGVQSAEQLRIIAQHIATQDADQARRLAADLASLAAAQAELRARLELLAAEVAALDARCPRTANPPSPPAPQLAPDTPASDAITPSASRE